MNESPVALKVAGLFSYPIKGCRGIDHSDAELLVSGLRHDREWMVVDTRRSPAQFLSQRECPLLAKLTVTVNDAGCLLLSRGADAPITVAPLSAYSRVQVTIWDHETVAQDAGNAAADWFAAMLGTTPGSVRLVRFHPETRRQCNPIYAGDSGAHTFFADGFPLLITSVASLAALNARMRRDASNAMPMNRFRPNLVLAGLPPWDEDHLDIIRIGDVALRLVKPCVRCQVTTTDQASGARLSDEPLNTLAKFRNNPDLGGVTFGWNAVVITPGRISTSSPVTAEYRF